MSKGIERVTKMPESEWDFNEDEFYVNERLGRIREVTSFVTFFEGGRALLEYNCGVYRLADGSTLGLAREIPASRMFAWTDRMATSEEISRLNRQHIAMLERVQTKMDIECGKFEDGADLLRLSFLEYLYSKN